MMKYKRSKKTDYRKRLKLLKSGKIRLVIRRSHNNLHVQFVRYEFNGDKILAEEISKNIKKYGWKAHCGNMPAAYLTGLLAGKKALEKGIGHCIIDIGMHVSNSSILYAVAKGVIDAGINVPLGFALKEERIKGLHIAEYAKLLKKDSERYKKQFSNYINAGLHPENLVQHLEDVKASILKSFPEKHVVEAK